MDPEILLTDIKEPPKEYKGEFQKLSVDNIDGVAKAAEVNVAMSNSFGFGGTNACIVLKKMLH